jgi:hypothetical protein
VAVAAVWLAGASRLRPPGAVGMTPAGLTPAIVGGLLGALAVSPGTTGYPAYVYGYRTYRYGYYGYRRYGGGCYFPALSPTGRRGYCVPDNNIRPISRRGRIKSD